MRRAGALLALLAAACAPAPERADPGDRFAMRTALTPYAAAICIARNARQGAGAVAEERTVGESSTEVVVRAAQGETLAVARVDHEGTFSRASVLVTPAVRGDRERFAHRLMSGC